MNNIARYSVRNKMLVEKWQFLPICYPYGIYSQPYKIKLQSFVKRFFLTLFLILLCGGFAFSQAIKAVVEKDGYDYIPISYLTDTATAGILRSPYYQAFFDTATNQFSYIQRNNEKAFEIYWFSICTDGRYELLITPEQIYLVDGHENPNWNVLFWVLPIDSLTYRQILNGFQTDGMGYFDRSYDEEKLLPKEKRRIKKEEYEVWNFDSCDSLLEAQIDKFFSLMNEFISDKAKKLDKTKRIIPQNSIYYGYCRQDLESWIKGMEIKIIKTKRK